MTKNYYIITEIIKTFNAKQGNLKKISGHAVLLDLISSSIFAVFKKAKVYSGSICYKLFFHADLKRKNMLILLV
jgi:hypothetical protein